MATHLTDPAPTCTAPGTLRPGRYAAIDIGTVTCRMLVADIDEAGALHELRREYAITNLGEGVDASGVLKPEAMQRVADVVARYQAILDACEPEDGGGITVTAVATSASRDARNADEFVALLAEAGITLTVVPGEREAALSFAGASCDFAGERILVVDVGGGSTELVAGQAGEAPVQAHSFDIGCRRVTEKFLEADPPSDEELGRARAWIAEEMRSYFDDLGAGRGVRPSGQRGSGRAPPHGRPRSWPRPRDRGGPCDLAGGAGPGRHAVVHGERVRHPARHRAGSRAHGRVACVAAALPRPARAESLLPYTVRTACSGKRRTRRRSYVGTWRNWHTQRT